MPGIGGRQLAKLLRAESPELKVMYMSGFMEGSDFSAGASPPGTAFLERPFTFAALRGQVDELIHDRSFA